MKLTSQIKNLVTNYTFIILMILTLLSCLSSNSFKDSLLGGGVLSLNGLNIIILLGISNILFVYSKRKLNNITLSLIGIAAISSLTFLLSLFINSIRQYLDFATFTHLLLILSIALFSYTFSVKGKALKWIALLLGLITLYFGIMGEVFTLLPSKVSNVMFTKVSSALNINYIDIRPDISASYNVSKENLSKGKALFGIGPNHYNLAFNLYKPANVVNSNYYNYSPSAAYSNFWTTITELGVLSIAFVLLGIYSVYLQIKSFRSITSNNFDGFINKTVFGWTVFSLLSFVFISNILVNIILLAICIAISIGSRSTANNSKTVKITIILAIAVVLIGVTLDSLKYISIRKLSSTLSSASSIDNLTDSLNNISLPIYTSDYYDVKTLANILAIKQTLESTSTDTNSLKEKFTSQLQTAVENSSKSIASNPTNYKSYINRGLIYEYSMLLDKEGGYKEAKSDYTNAANLNPSNPEIYTMIANLENYYGNATTSLQFAGKSIMVKPNYTNGYIQLAIIFKNMKDEAKVIEALEYALNSSPNDVNIAKALADEYQLNGQTDKASKIYTEIEKYNAALQAQQNSSTK